MGNAVLIKIKENEILLDIIMDSLIDHILNTEDNYNLLNKNRSYLSEILAIVQALEVLHCLTGDNFRQLFENLSHLSNLKEKLNALVQEKSADTNLVNVLVENAQHINELSAAYNKLEKGIKDLELKDSAEFKKFCLDAFVKSIDNASKLLLPENLIKLKQNDIPYCYASYIVSRAHLLPGIADGIIQLKIEKLLDAEYMDGYMGSFEYYYLTHKNTYIEDIRSLKKEKLFEKFGAKVNKNAKCSHSLTQGLIILKEIEALDKFNHLVFEYPANCDEAAKALRILKNNSIKFDGYAKLFFMYGDYAEDFSGCIISLEKAKIHLINGDDLVKCLSTITHLRKILNCLQQKDLLRIEYFNLLVENENILASIRNAFHILNDDLLLTKPNLKTFMDLLMENMNALPCFHQQSAPFTHRWNQREFSAFIETQKKSLNKDKQPLAAAKENAPNKGSKSLLQKLSFVAENKQPQNKEPDSPLMEHIYML